MFVQTGNDGCVEKLQAARESRCNVEVVRIYGKGTEASLIEPVEDGRLGQGLGKGFAVLETRIGPELPIQGQDGGRLPIIPRLGCLPIFAQDGDCLPILVIPVSRTQVIRLVEERGGREVVSTRRRYVGPIGEEMPFAAVA